VFCDFGYGVLNLVCIQTLIQENSVNQNLHTLIFHKLLPKMQLMKKLTLIFFGLLIISLTGCSTLSKPIYFEKYQVALNSNAINLENENISKEWVAERFSGIMNQFKAVDVVERAATHFAPTLYFNDTWHTFSDSKTLGEYLKRTGERVHNIEVLVQDVVVSQQDAYVRWSMSFVINEGEESIDSYGMTHLRFDENKQIVLYQDYWDGVEGFYRTLPVVGKALAYIKSRLG
jgi:hypothetical protein